MSGEYIPLSFENGIECNQCQKRFFTMRPSEWVYKKKVSLTKRSPESKQFAHYNETKYFCSWKCLREWEQINKPPEKEENNYSKRFTY